jgi:hypothetical protein
MHSWEKITAVQKSLRGQLMGRTNCVNHLSLKADAKLGPYPRLLGVESTGAPTATKQYIQRCPAPNERGQPYAAVA